MSDDSLSPELDQAELGVLEAFGTRRATTPGEYLYRAGDSGYDFYVILSGRAEVLVDGDGQDVVLVTHGPGRFLGELNLLSGTRVFVTVRMAEAGEVLAIPVEGLRRIIATIPRLSDKILATFMARRSELMGAAAHATRVVRVSVLS